MEHKKLIRITKNRIFLTPEMSLNLSQTNLAGKHLSFRTVEDIYFEVQVLAFDESSRRVSVEVVDYHPKNLKGFNEQIAKAQILFIHFKPLKWQYLGRFLSSYTKSVLLREEIVFDDVVPMTSDLGEQSFLRDRTEPKLIEPFIEKITEDGKVYFKDIDFNLGFASFSYKSKKLNQAFNLKVENHFLLREFNAIKFYFPKVFGGRKQFSINIIFALKDKVVTDIITTSKEIDGINQNILDSIKRDRVARLTSTPLRNSVDKSLFTAEDIFDSFEDNLADGNIFRQSEEEILKCLIETRTIRNAKHLQFLSGSKHSTKEKLRFTLKPLFGFVFFIEGGTKNHFCWELLNSHATYLWSFDKIDTDAKFQFKRVEETINIIRDMGRETYKNDFKNNKVDSDLSFCSIEHSDVNSAFKDGFVEWQHRLIERLV